MNTYSFRAYVQARLVYCIAFAIISLLSWGVLRGLGVGESVCILLLGTFALLFFVSLGIDYATGRDFFKSLSMLANSKDPLHEIEQVKASSNPQEALMYSALENYSVYARSALNNARISNMQYQEFIETWVHEIKTPLSALELIVQNNPNETSFRIQKELARLSMYIDQALYVARVGSLEKDFSVQVESVQDLIRRTLKSRKSFLIESQVSITLPKDDVCVMCDAKWIVFMLGQILDNAFKFADRTKPGLELVFACERTHTKAHDVVKLSITDNGIGIADSDITRVFDKGFVGENGRVSTNQKSTGLGLYLIKQMAHKMDIDVFIDSKLGKFTTLTLILPCANNS